MHFKWDGLHAPPYPTLSPPRGGPLCGPISALPFPQAVVAFGQREAPGQGKKPWEESEVWHLFPGLACGVTHGAASSPEGRRSFTLSTTSAVSRF